MPRPTHRNRRRRHPRPHPTQKTSPPLPNAPYAPYGLRLTCERMLRTVYPTLKVHMLPKHVTRQLNQLMDQPIPHSIRKNSHTYTTDLISPPARTHLTYRELFRIFSGYAPTPNTRTGHTEFTPRVPYLVLLKGGCVRDIVQGKSIADIHDIDFITQCLQKRSTANPMD